MIFLALLYVCLFSASQNPFALPTDFRSPQNFPRNDLEAIFIREDESRFGSRSIYGILWSCLSTIFTCTWIVVHPNIPAPGDSQWAVLRRRIAIMGYVLLGPEMVIYWAWRQHSAARSFAKKHGENTGWTRVHAFFLIMGGFTLHEGGRPIRVLVAQELEELSQAGKAIVLFQTTWFIIQCIARGAYGLTVTELEVVTLAYASLTGIIYYLWWDKPLDVRCSIPVHLLEGHFGENEGDIKKEETDSRIISAPDISEQEILEAQEIVVVPSLLTPVVQVDTSNPDPALTGSHIFAPPEVSDQRLLRGDEKAAIEPDAHISIQVVTLAHDPLTRMERFQAFRRRSCTKRGTLLGLGYVFIVFPLKRFFLAIGDMIDRETLGDKALRVPTFYAPPIHDNVMVDIVAYCVATVFGAIHCIAWSFHFSTLQERWAWRISAILVSGLPVITSIFGEAPFDPENKTTWIRIYQHIIQYILRIIICLYIIARIILLVLPFIALRALPPGAYVQLDWINFLPHI